MFDIKWIRDNAESFDEGQIARGAEASSSRLISLDDERVAHVRKLQDAQTRRNAASKEIGKAKATGDEEKAKALMAEVGELKGFIQGGEAKERELQDALTAALSSVPNIALDDVPAGQDENDNVVHHTWGDKPQMDFAPKEHFELGEALGQMDFEIAAKLSGSRFVVLKGQLARLERAIGQFMIDVHVNEHGCEEVSVPTLVRSEAMYGTGQLPKFSEDAFHTDDDRWLIPTSEVPLTNLVRDSIMDAEQLPMRVTALSHCYRSEAGSSGRDTRGMLRQHQFTKVEMVSITDEDSSVAEQDRMLECAETILKKLGISYRVMTLCCGDMGFSARRTFDIEAWLPGQNSFREISSVSVCGDFQARRMNARYRVAGEKSVKFVHTLNGSGVAVGRCLIAVMENYQTADGSIVVPEVLRPYMGGQEIISAKG
ncbi:serine--tRNA ligase [Cohaesibacter celericrescens]|uniref:Serine--tRNA ligase n=1 Tax=Cohaesibacter celericrescens TaxID=2067669 RepID=A0A2N5XSU3_9HYPH|nr:serine--tRNA ligase [Cohaesibacter celericrescens]PLW77591.1 serine--tRNA ligase [Cohaesibacter celericrescens]